MIWNLLLGAGFGLALWALADGMRTRRVTLAERLAAADRSRPSTPAPVTPPASQEGEVGWVGGLGRPLAPLLAATGLPGRRLATDLRTLGAPVDRFLAEKAATALLGLLAPQLAGVALAATGTTGAWALPTACSVLLAAAGFFLPDLTTRQRARDLREEARHALSLFLDMTVVALHGGAGIQQALVQAAQAGHGQCFDELRAALTEAEITRQPPWGPLARLGECWDVPDLPALAASVQLAGSEGARITASLTAKAESLRTALLADSEARATSATERMSLPVVLLFAGFLLFVGYPACANALNGL